jgi:hypothetical protein
MALRDCGTLGFAGSAELYRRATMSSSTTTRIRKVNANMVVIFIWLLHGADGT